MTKITIKESNEQVARLVGNTIRASGVYKLTESKISPECVGNLYLFNPAVSRLFVSLIDMGMHRTVSDTDIFARVASMSIGDIKLETV